MQSNIDSLTWGYILHVRPSATKNDIKGLRWLNQWDLLIEFMDGEKCLYDTFTKYFRFITYNRYTITEDQFRNEFKTKLNSMMQRTNFSQEMLAESIGSSQQMISRYCTGDAMPSQFTIHKIALALKCKDTDLIYQEY